MLCERRNPNSKFRKYFKTLPKSLRNFPIFYTREERELLIGSKFLKQIKEKKDDIK